MDIFQFGELSLTTNPSYALYNSPHHHSTTPKYSISTTTLLGTARSPTNIYTRVPTRTFTPYDSSTLPLTTSSTVLTTSTPIHGTSNGLTMPLLSHHHNTLAGGTIPTVDEKS